MRILRKVVADLWNASGRAGLVILAMVTGLVGVISVTTTKAVLARELRRSFDAIVPASATIRSAPFSRALLDSVARVPGVGAVDAGRTLSARVQIGDQRIPVLLFSVADYAHMTVNKLRPQTGSWPPPNGKVLLERAAVQVAGMGIGETLSVRIGNASPVPLEIAGTIHDFSQAPAWQEGMIFGYVAPETMAQLAGNEGFTELRLVVADQRLNVAHIRTVARRVATALDKSGSRVRDIQIPRPGEHPHQAQMNSLLAMQQAFGGVALLLSGALIIVLFNAMLAQQRRQIGSMKAMGAGRGAILQMYVFWVLVLAMCAVVIALPTGLVVGRAFAGFSADMLNFDLEDQSIPWSLMATLVGLGVLLPLIFALLPILRASSITTRAALSDVAMIPSGALRRGPRRSTESRLWRLVMLGVANAHRMRGRFALVVGTLAVGGALFLSALNLGRSLQSTLAVNFARMGYDISLGVGGETPVSTVETTLRAIPGVARVEASATARAMLIDEQDENPRAFPVSGLRTLEVPATLAPMAGRWLRAGDRRVVVANHLWRAEHPQYAVGDSIVLRIGSDSARWLLAGIVREVFVGPQLYAGADGLELAMRGAPGVTQVHVISDAHTVAAASAVMQRIERAFDAQGVALTGMSGLQNIRQHREDHMLVIISFLVAMAVLSQIVGGFGLATMLSVGLFERSQELGVMRAVGATRWQLLLTVIVEGTWIAFVAWIGSILLALPATWVLNGVFGRMWLATSLDYTVSLSAIPWLAAVAGTIAIVASGFPAWRASTREPRELLTAV
jgi:putative ABC transport system permease protein